MPYIESLLLSFVLMIFILVDILRLPLINKDRGSRFFIELAVSFFIFLILSVLATVLEEGYIQLPLMICKILWTLQFLSFPFIVIMWMHFNAMNVIDDQNLVRKLTAVHVLPYVVLAAIAIADIGYQRFYPFDRSFVHLSSSPGTTYLMILTLFYCVSMILPTLGHRRELHGSYLFLSLLMPSALSIALITFRLTHSYVMFIMVNSFMMVLFYLIGQRDSIRVDPLTGLSSKELFDRKINKIFRSKSNYSIVFIEIENFQFFKTRYGSMISDELLILMSKYLIDVASSSETYRIADDRFCLCLNSQRYHDIEHIISQIKERGDRPWTFGEKELFIQMNIAAVAVPQQVRTQQEFDLAMNELLLEMKTVGKNSTFMYSRENSTTQQKKLNIISALRESIRNPDQVIVHYQPIYEVKTERLVSAEALMRIDDRDLGFLPPSEFITLAEQSGLIVPLTRILLDKVCRTIRTLSSFDHSLEYISVNLSAEDFEAKGVGKELLCRIENCGILPHNIGFEITESVVLQSFETVAKVMMELSVKKITFALDDFGTGYSNFRALMDLPYDFVKIDRSVIQKSTSNATMLTLLTEMLHKMDKCIIAEGVETLEQLNIIRDINIERVQGFFYSKPLDEDTFISLVKDSDER
ncbi:MAG: EAL domain-containing protein [Sphaerochaetaceae bacterium]